MPNLNRACEIIVAARQRGDRYAGRFAQFAAAEIARVEGVPDTRELYVLACNALAKLNEGKSLMDCIVIKSQR